MGNTILFEDMEYSVTSDPDGYNHFIDNFNKQFHCNIDQLIIDGRIIKLKENQGWHFFGKNKFDTMKNNLDEYLKIIDFSRLKLNPHLKGEIAFNCNMESQYIKEVLESYFNEFPDDVLTFVMPFNLICSTIIQLPAIVLEAFDKYPNSGENEQLIYCRYDFIHSKTQLAFDKFRERNIALEQAFNYFLAKDNKRPLISLFIFTDTFINILKYSDTGTKNFDTKLFREFFSSIMNYKERFISVFEDFKYSNIIEVERYFEKIRPEIDTLEKACGGKDTKKYLDIKAWFIQNNFCDPDTFIWDKKFTLACLAGYLKDLNKKRYIFKLTNTEMLAIAKNSFHAEMSIDTMKRAKRYPPEIPPFKD